MRKEHQNKNIRVYNVHTTKSIYYYKYILAEWPNTCFLGSDINTNFPKGDQVFEKVIEIEKLYPLVFIQTSFQQCQKQRNVPNY